MDYVWDAYIKSSIYYSHFYAVASGHLVAAAVSTQEEPASVITTDKGECDSSAARTYHTNT